MASPVYDTSARVAYSVVTNQTLSYTAASGAALFACISVLNASDILSSATYNSVSMNLVNKIETAAVGGWAYMYFLGNAGTGGALTIAAGISGGVGKNIAISAISYTNASNVTPAGGNQATASASSVTTWSQSLIPSVTGGLAVAYINEQLGRTVTVGANTTSRQDGGGSGDHLVDSGTNTVTNGVSFSLNISSFSGGTTSTESIMAIVNPPAAVTANGNFLRFM